MKLAVRNSEGKELRTLDVDDSVFGIEPNAAVLHQAFVTGRNNQRAGTAQTKTRGLVQGSTHKIRKQKYTGRSRQGSIRAPHHVGGGVVFGPVLRSYAQALNKKMRRLAIRSALSGKVADGQLVVIDQLAFQKPRTKEILRILRNVGIERSALVVTSQSDRSLLASVRNVPKTKAMPAAYLNVVDMMNYRSVLITEEAVRIAERLWGQKAAPVEAPAPPAARRAPARKAETRVEPKAEAQKPVKARAKKAEAPAEPPPEVQAEAPKPARARKPAAPKPGAAAEAPPEVVMVESPKPAKARKPATPKAPAEKAKPARAARKPKAQAKAATPDAPAPKRRTRKAAEGKA
jgi:large subunit ribosomal protein L4